MKKVILTGIRANEEPTIGNLLGAILPIIRLANQYSATHQINMFVPDLHSFGRFEGESMRILLRKTSQLHKKDLSLMHFAIGSVYNRKATRM